MRSNILFLLLILLSCISCGNNRTKSVGTKSVVRFATDTLSIVNTLNKNISIFVQNENVMSFKDIEKESISMSLLDVARKCKDKNEMALIALKNSNTLEIKVVVDNEIDTTYKYHISPYYDEDGIFSISGKCAPLTSIFSNPSQTVDIKKWLFRKREHLTDDNIHLLQGIVNQLSHTKTTKYITNSIIPVIHGFSGLKYKVSSSIVADYYVLYACSTAKEIEAFVEDVVSNNFDLCVKSLNGGMECYRRAGSNGYKCICLIGINKDWSYKVQPLGLVAIDNLAPVSSISSLSDENSSITFPNNITVLFPTNKPQINGFCNVSVSNWAGNGIECNVSFVISFAGDVKSVTVKRTKKLCYDSWTHRVENKVVDLTGKSSPYTFTYMLHFTDGDNYIPIIIEDNHGNKRELELNVRAEFVRTDVPSIDIDNNINIDNY